MRQVDDSHRRASAQVLVVLLTMAMLATAGIATAEETWRSDLYPADWAPPTDRSFAHDKLIQDFSYAGYHRGERPIPDVEGPIHNVLDYDADPTGERDSTGAIQAAIDAAAEAGGGVVYLPEGTYRLTADDADEALRVAHSQIVIRGDGPDRTFLRNDTWQMRSTHVIRFRPPGGGNWRSAADDGAETAITDDLLWPTRQIPVQSTDGFAEGDWVVVRADATRDFIADHNLEDYWGEHAERLGGLTFYRKITAIDHDAGLLTIDAPIRYYLKTRDNARVYHTSDHLEEVGLEHLSIGNQQHPDADGWGMSDYTDSDAAAWDTHASYLVSLNRVRNGWVRNVHSWRPDENELDVHMLSNGLRTNFVRGVTIRDCVFERAQYGGGGGNGYMIRLANTNETLVQDCHVSHNRHGLVVSSMGSAGNVFHRGSARETGWQGAGDQQTSGRGSDHHMHLSQSTLMDSITVEREWLEARYRQRWGGVPHAITATHCVFWNIRGEAYFPGRDYIVHSAQTRYGYVIGTQGPAHGVNLDGPENLIEPTDHVEGVGRGETLEPASLYEDQLRRRLQRQEKR